MHAQPVSHACPVPVPAAPPKSNKACTNKKSKHKHERDAHGDAPANSFCPRPALMVRRVSCRRPLCRASRALLLLQWLRTVIAAPSTLPAALRAWGLRHLGDARLTAVVENATIMSACIQFSGRVCTLSARFHVSGLDNHQKVSSILRGPSKPLGSDMTGYHLKLPRDVDGGVIVDYGGNIGIAAVAAYLLNREHHDCVRVISIEPVPESYLMLRWNLIENSIPVIAPHHAGEQGLRVGERQPLGRRGGASCGVRALNMAASRDGRNVSLLVGYRSMNAVVDGVGLPPEADTALRRYPVTSTTLADLLDRMMVATSRPVAADILKLDCEGCEAEVYQELRTSPSLADRIGAVTGELHGCGREHASSTRQRCKEMSNYFRGRWNRSQNSLQLV